MEGRGPALGVLDDAALRRGAADARGRRPAAAASATVSSSAAAAASRRGLDDLRTTVAAGPVDPQALLDAVLSALNPPEHRRRHPALPRPHLTRETAVERERESVPVPRTSAGILLYRRGPGGVSRCWSGTWAARSGRRRTPAGGRSRRASTAPARSPFAVARREFEEELGSPVPATEFAPLGRPAGDRRQGAHRLGGGGRSRRRRLVSNTFELEWPPKSGRMQQFPEIDRSAWLPVSDARIALVAGQVPFLDRLMAHLAVAAAESDTQA